MPNTPMPTELPELVRPKRLAEFYAVNPVTLWRWVRSGQHPSPVKLSPGVVAYKRADVLRFLEQRSAASEG